MALRVARRRLHRYAARRECPLRLPRALRDPSEHLIGSMHRVPVWGASIVASGVGNGEDRSKGIERRFWAALIASSTVDSRREVTSNRMSYSAANWSGEAEPPGILRARKGRRADLQRHASTE